MSVAILTGDCRDVLRTLPDASVHCVVTSPPYWGLRDYGTATWEGGDPGCIHKPPQEWIDHNFNANSAFGNGAKTQSAAAKSRWYNQDGSCRCGAHRIDSQLGLEPIYTDYIETMVAVFREVKRVLRPDGTLWLNMGDSYAGGGHGGGGSYEAERDWRKGNLDKNNGNSNRDGLGRVSGLKPKDLCGIPWRLAFALQADGWYLRQDIIWSKPNPMPESVRDRCTKAHEYLFLLSKSGRYYYDAEAIAEAMAGEPHVPGNRVLAGGKIDAGHLDDRVWGANGKRNRRSVWEIATAPFPEAHFATFPPALIEPCILAGCPKECCAKCGAPWVRETESEFVKLADRRPTRKAVQPGADMADINSHNKMGFNRVTTLGFSPSCSCNAGTVPGTALDPFGGAGTTGLVADRLGRNAILIELNPQYAEMARRRIQDDAGMFADVQKNTPAEVMA